MSTIIDGDVEVGGDFARDTPVPKAVKHEVPVEEASEEAPAEEAEAPEEGVEASEEAPESEERPKKPTAKERIQELNRQKRELERRLKEVETQSTASQLARIEKLLTGEIKLPNGATSDNVDAIGAPDPTDSAKYPLGALDDRYIQDAIRFGIESRLQADRQRQAEDARKAQEQLAAQQTLEKARAIVAKGAELYDDFEEVVWERGLRGEYRMEEPTFRAIGKIENGADVAYFLATNEAEAAKVAAMDQDDQVLYVARKSAELAAKKAPKLPKAGSPPAYQARGTSGKFEVDPSTDDLGAFKRALFTR